MASRLSSSVRSRSAKERTQRSPLLESTKLANLSVSSSERDIDDLTVLLSPVKSMPMRHKSRATGSPARRIPKAISSPARRASPSKHNSASLQLQCIPLVATHRDTSQALVSPIRTLSGSRSQIIGPSTSGTAPAEVELSVCLSASMLSQRPRRTAAKVAPSQHGTEPGKLLVGLNPVSMSPLKRPARRMHDSSRLPVRQSPDSAESRNAHTTNHISPLKKPPSRIVAKPKGRARVEGVSLVLPDLSNSVDELSLPTSLKEMRQKSTATNSSAQISTMTDPTAWQETASRSLDDQETTRTENIKEKPVSICYTPIKMPMDVRHAHSPPSEENMDDDDDLWTPSVPLSLSSTFSQLNIDSREWSPKSAASMKKPSHIFFDDEEKEEAEESDDISVCDALAQSARSQSRISTVKPEALTGPIIYIDCKTSDASTSSEYFASILNDLGAKTLQRWNWNPDTQHTPRRRSRVGLSHVVFFGGAARTLKKVQEARKMGIDVKCVGLSWVMQCKKSQCLTIGTEGHEIDVESELIKLNHIRRKSMEPTRLSTPQKRVEVEAASVDRTVNDYQSPVKFADAEDDIPFSVDTLTPAMPIMSAVSREITLKLPTEFENKQLVLARRNSFKFKPSVSSPLSKKTWRA